MRIRAFLLIAVLLIVAAINGIVTGAAPLAAGNIGLVADDPDLTEFPQMALVLQVMDGQGNVVPNLNRENFELFESTQTGQEPVSVKELDTGLRKGNLFISLVLDIRGDIGKEELAPVRDAVFGLVDQFALDGDPEGDLAELWIVGADPPLQQEYTLEGRRLVNKANQALPPSLAQGSLDETLKRVLSKTDNPKEHQVVIVINATPQTTDSIDPVVIQLALSKNVPIFAIDVGDSPEQKMLFALTVPTGGDIHFPTRDSITTLRDKVWSAFKLEYVLRFRSGLSQDGKKHSLRIIVKTSQGDTETIKEFSIPSDERTVRPFSFWLGIVFGALAILAIVFAYLGRRELGRR